VDKNPGNFWEIGLIAGLFPKAKIVHCVRHPVDTCLSCYFQNFSQKVDFSFDLSILAEYYISYRRMMDHWYEVHGGRIVSIAYEDLVEKRSSAIRDLIASLDLPWHDACLTSHQSSRIVKTASMWQVKSPIYDSSVNGWIHYAKHLSPLISRLQPYL